MGPPRKTFWSDEAETNESNQTSKIHHLSQLQAHPWETEHHLQATELKVWCLTEFLDIVLWGRSSSPAAPSGVHTWAHIHTRVHTCIFASLRSLIMLLMCRLFIFGNTICFLVCTFSNLIRVTVFCMWIWEWAGAFLLGKLVTQEFLVLYLR